MTTQIVQEVALHPTLFEAPSFTVDVDTSRRRITLAGELDVATAPLLQDAGELFGTHPGPVTLDLTAVSFIDSSGLGGVVRLRNHLLDLGSELSVAGSSGGPAQAFVVGGLGFLLGEPA